MASTLLIDALTRILSQGSPNKLGPAPPGSKYEAPVLDSSETRRGSAAGTGTPRATAGQDAQGKLSNEVLRPPGMRNPTPKQIRAGVRRYAKSIKGKKGNIPKSGRMY